MTGSEPMPASKALITLRRLDAEARRGWPDGYDAQAVAREAIAAVAILANSVAAAPPPLRATVARRYVRALRCGEGN